MTLKERVIVETYTGVCMNVGADREELYKYWSELMDRPVFTHELASEEFQEELAARSKADFLALCQGKTSPTEFDCLAALNEILGKAIPEAEKHTCRCNKCGTHNSIWEKRKNVVPNDIVYCWHCGQAHRLEA